MNGWLLDITTLDAPTRWLLLVAVGLTIFYAIMRPRWKKKDPLEKRPQFGLASQRAVERDMNNLLVELSEMARQLTAQLDTRARKLELLIEQADERIAELKKLRESGGSAPAPQGNATPPAAGPAPVDDRHLQVYELADQSMSAQQIATKLTRPRGEIELILALRRKSE